MYYKDDFNVTFKEESAFYRYLDDVEKRAEWFRAQSKDLKVEAVTKEYKEAKDVSSRVELDKNLALIHI